MVEAILLSALPKYTKPNLPAFPHTVKQGAVNTNFESLLVRLGQGIEPMYTNYEADALTTESCVGT